MMDDLDTVGRYGTISLIRKNNFQAVTSYPVDDERTTFGRDPKCSIRMYFHDVDLLHCTLYFEDSKAYIHVKGQTGITVDDLHVPAGSTVQLNNNSKFTIWRKLFQFTYPPRELRTKLLETPRGSRKSLRMSMIHSAFILTPSNAAKQTLDLKTLQSPIKPYREAPEEVVTFVDSENIAVVEDAAQKNDDDGALVALEEIELNEEDQQDDEFSRTPIKRAPLGNPFSALRNGVNTPNRPSTPSALAGHRRTSSLANIAPVPALSSITRTPSAAGPLSPRPTSSLVPRDIWRDSGLPPPRTPPRKKQSRMSMHKAVLMRSAHRAHIAAATAKEEHDEEMAVEEVVSPERKMQLDGGEDDAEGEDDYEVETKGDEAEKDEAPASGGVMGIFTSVASFVRKSLSPERKNNTVERPTTTAEDIAEEEGVEGEERPGRSRPQPLSAQASFNPFATPGRSILKPTTTPQTQVATSPAVAHATSSASKAGRSLRFDFKPFAGWGATKEESEDMDVDEPEQAKPLGTFFTPQATRTLPAQTNTVIRPAAATPSLNSFFSKPVRPSRPLDLSLSHVPPSALVSPVKDEEDDKARLEKELRAKRRQSALEAMDAAGHRALPDPSARRQSMQAVPPSPFTSPMKPTMVGVNPFDRTNIEKDISSPSASDDESLGLEKLKATVAKMRRESVVRAARLSLGAGVLAPKGGTSLLAPQGSLDTIMSQETQLLDLEDHLIPPEKTQPVVKRVSDASEDMVENEIEVDITEAEVATETQEEAAKDEVESVTSTLQATTSQESVETATSTKATRGNKRPSSRSRTRSPAKRSTRRKVEEQEAVVEEQEAPPRRRGRSATPAASVVDVEVPVSTSRSTRRKHEEGVVEEEAPRRRRGRSATPAASVITEVEVPVSTSRSTRRAPSQDPLAIVGSVKTPSSRGRSRTTAVVEEVVEEVEEEVEEVEEPVVVKKAASAKGKVASKIAQPKAPQTAPVKKAESSKPPSGLRVVRRTAPASTEGPSKPVRATRGVSQEPTAVTKPTASRGRTTPKPTPSEPVPRAKPSSSKPPSTATTTGTRVKRSTRPPADTDDDAEVEDSNPRKRRKAVKEEEDVPAPAPKKTPASRVPTSKTTAVPARRTPATRNVSSDHDKENTPESGPSTARGKGALKTPAATAGPSRAVKTEEVTSASRSLRTRAKK